MDIAGLLAAIQNGSVQLYANAQHIRGQLFPPLCGSELSRKFEGLPGLCMVHHTRSPDLGVLSGGLGFVALPKTTQENLDSKKVAGRSCKAAQLAQNRFSDNVGGVKYILSEGNPSTPKSAISL
jgi:hypothetical protein